MQALQSLALYSETLNKCSQARDRKSGFELHHSPARDTCCRMHPATGQNLPDLPLQIDIRQAINVDSGKLHTTILFRMFFS